MLALLTRVAKDYKLKKSELLKRYLRKAKKKARAPKVIVTHSHPVDNVYHADCVLCNSHGNLMDPGTTSVEYEMVVVQESPTLLEEVVSQ